MKNESLKEILKKIEKQLDLLAEVSDEDITEINSKIANNEKAIKTNEDAINSLSKKVDLNTEKIEELEKQIFDSAQTLYYYWNNSNMTMNFCVATESAESHEYLTQLCCQFLYDIANPSFDSELVEIKSLDVACRNTAHSLTIDLSSFELNHNSTIWVFNISSILYKNIKDYIVNKKVLNKEVISLSCHYLTSGPDQTKHLNYHSDVNDSDYEQPFLFGHVPLNGIPLNLYYILREDEKNTNQFYYEYDKHNDYPYIDSIYFTQIVCQALYDLCNDEVLDVQSINRLTVWITRVGTRSSELNLEEFSLCHDTKEKKYFNVDSALYVGVNNFLKEVFGNNEVTQKTIYFQVKFSSSESRVMYGYPLKPEDKNSQDTFKMEFLSQHVPGFP